MDKSDQTAVSITIPLYVSYITASPDSHGWDAVNSKTQLEFTFYNKSESEPTAQNPQRDTDIEVS